MKQTDAEKPKDRKYETYQFINEWLWDAEKFGGKRYSETMNKQQVGDCVQMIIYREDEIIKALSTKGEFTEQDMIEFASIYRFGRDKDVYTTYELLEQFKARKDGGK